MDHLLEEEEEIKGSTLEKLANLCRTHRVKIYRKGGFKWII